MDNTPLGKIIQVRSEEDKEMLKHFSPTQHRIRNDWRSKVSAKMTEEDLDSMMIKLEQMFANAFS